MLSCQKIIWNLQILFLILQKQLWGRFSFLKILTNLLVELVDPTSNYMTTSIYHLLWYHYFIYTLEKAEGAITNGPSRDTGESGTGRRQTKHKKHNTETKQIDYLFILVSNEYIYFVFVTCTSLHFVYYLRRNMLLELSVTILLS